jgi:hypothetical protein
VRGRVLSVLGVSRSYTPPADEAAGRGESIAILRQHQLPNTVNYVSFTTAPFLSWRRWLRRSGRRKRSPPFQR